MGEDNEKSDNNSTESSEASDDDKSDVSSQGPSSPRKNMSREDVKRLLQDMKVKQRFGEVKNTGVNTGGIKGTGKLVKRETSKVHKKKTTKEYADKFRVSIPLSEAVYIKPNLRGYVSNLLTEAAYQKGTPVRVVRGTQIIEVTPEQHEKERAILENAELNDTSGVMKEIKKLTTNSKGKKIKGDKSNHIKD
jgi:hypothetical protein